MSYSVPSTTHHFFIEFMSRGGVGGEELAVIGLESKSSGSSGFTCPAQELFSIYNRTA